MKDKLKQYEKYLTTSNLKNSTIKNYLWHLKQFFIWLEEKELNNNNLDSYLEYLTNKYQKTNSVNLQLVVLNSYLEFIQNNYKYKLLQNTKADLKHLTQIQLSKLLDSPLKNSGLIGLRDKVLLEILYNSGLKVSEIAKIKLDNIDWLNKKININEKGIELNTLIWPYLKKYTNLRNDDNPFLFINLDRAKKSQNESLSVRSVERIIERYTKTLKPPIKASPQILRNTKAYYLKKQGGTAGEIKEKLNFQTTAAAKKYLREI